MGISGWEANGRHVGNGLLNIFFIGFRKKNGFNSDDVTVRVRGYVYVYSFTT